MQVEIMDLAFESNTVWLNYCWTIIISKIWDMIVAWNLQKNFIVVFQN